jgi:pimeloyl-ACP methyl ester carboxylesterase
MMPLLAGSSVHADWKKDLDKLIVTDKAEDADRIIRSIIAECDDVGKIESRIDSLSFKETAKDTLIIRKTHCIDDVDRPYAVYIPPTYDKRTATPLIVVLHGGVGQRAIPEESKEYAKNHPFTSMARENGWLALYPFGQAGATWWDVVGMANIRNLVRVVKSEYNVDDDRVWMGGFSDGASASFSHAMLAPTDFGAFVALNGFMGVASHEGLPTYPVNLFNSPIYAVNSTRDQLFPSNQMRKSIELAIDAGARIFFREREGTHRFDYAEEELPLITEFLMRHPRAPFPEKITWESSIWDFGQCRWLAIDSVADKRPRRWHRKYNGEIVDSTKSIGIYVDDSSSGKGVMVAGIAFGDNLGGRAGLKKGDIIVACNGDEIDDFADLSASTSALRYGDPVTIRVKRGNELLDLQGSLPEPRTYRIFNEIGIPSALIKAEFSGNVVNIQSSRLKAFRILIHPDMFNVRQKIKIVVDGEVVFDELVAADPGFLLKNYWENLDRKLLYVAEVKINL